MLVGSPPCLAAEPTFPDSTASTPDIAVYYPAPRPRGEFEVLTLPLRKVGNLLLIEAEIDSMRGNFILDLGAPCLVLNSTYFRDYQVDQDYYASRLNASGVLVRRTAVDRLQVLDLFYQNLSADIVDLGAIENQRGIQILGLMGVNLFRDFTFDLNVQDLQLTLYRNPQDLVIEDTLLFQAPIKAYGDHLVVQGMLNGKKT